MKEKVFGEWIFRFRNLVKKTPSKLKKQKYVSLISRSLLFLFLLIQTSLTFLIRNFVNAKMNFSLRKLTKVFTSHWLKDLTISTRVISKSFQVFWQILSKEIKRNFLNFLIIHLNKISKNNFIHSSWFWKGITKIIPNEEKIYQLSRRSKKIICSSWEKREAKKANSSLACPNL